MSQANQSDYQPGELSSVQDEQKVLEGKGLSDSACSFTPLEENFDTVVAESKPDCKHCNARKEAIIRLIPDAVTRLAAKGRITWVSHEITNEFDILHVRVFEGDSEFDPSGFFERIELFFLENSKYRYF
jgi:hypothetical protein